MSKQEFTQVNIDTETHSLLKLVAENQHRSMAGQVRYLVEREAQKLNIKEASA